MTGNPKPGFTISNNLGEHFIIHLADINNDGIPEIIAGNYIFNAQTGELLLSFTFEPDGTGYGNPHALPKTYAVGNDGYYFMPAVGDIDGDGDLEIVAGSTVYDIEIINENGTFGNSLKSIRRVNAGMLPAATQTYLDGPTVILDFDLDGQPDVCVIGYQKTKQNVSSELQFYVWNPRTSEVIAYAPKLPATWATIPYVGDLDGNGYPDFAFATIESSIGMISYQFDGSEPGNIKVGNTKPAFAETSGFTVFDFNQDRKSEIVYRGTNRFYIVDGATLSDVSPPETAYSGTIAEYPIVADIDDDGQAEIILAKNPTAWGNTDITGQLAIYKTGNPAEPWAPARKVWNQWAYNSVYINENMTVPRFPLSPATVFPGSDGVLKTSDDVRPYNGFLMQQTMLNKNGMPLWLAPNAIPDQSITSSSVSGNTMSIKIGIINTDDAAIGSPVYVTLYKESSSSGIKIGTGMENIQILPRDTGYVTVTIADITPFLPMVNVVARINDDGTDFPYQGECKDYDNELTLINPALTLMMNKDATLNSVSERGTNSNPASVLFNEEIEYEITVVNANLGSGDVIINDTLPAYLNFVTGSATENITSTPVGGNPARDLLTWTYPNVASMGTKTVKYKAMPADGVCASQPLFVNRAWVLVSDTIYVETNSTYHQGAGVSVVTFSAGLGGNIFNAEPQAVDYRTSASEGIVVVPEEGYRFAGWSHDGYVSLRGETVPARKGVMYYDTLAIYGHVELTALFELEEYPIYYYLNGGYAPADNPTVYTIESGKILLLEAAKDGDVFVGWTGSNGDTPNPEVCISEGSTGVQTFYANFLYSGREDEKEPERAENKIWAYKGELYIHTNEAGSVVRIYSTDGILCKLHTIEAAGETSIKLPRGVYIVTINNQAGQKIMIE